MSQAPPIPHYPSSMIARLLLACVALAALFALTACGNDDAAPSPSESPPPAPATPTSATPTAGPLASADSWHYQLQGPGGAPLDLAPLLLGADAPARGVDLLVVDYSRDGSDAGAFTAAEVAAARAGGARLLAYLSIGEAESYRFYWDDAWSADGNPTAAAPDWLAPPNPAYPDNFLVRFWEPAWQEQILGPDGYLARVAAAGFDGVYLDRVDAWEDWWDPNAGLPPIPAADMAAFVEAIAAHARQSLGLPDFLVVVQNAPTILDSLPPDDRARYLTAIDALAVEDTFYFGPADEDNPLDIQLDTLAAIRLFLDAGKPVFAVDYLLDPAAQADFVRRALDAGFVPLVAPRALDRRLPQP